MRAEVLVISVLDLDRLKEQGLRSEAEQSSLPHTRTNDNSTELHEEMCRECHTLNAAQGIRESNSVRRPAASSSLYN
jgi:hypothetical protein